MLGLAEYDCTGINSISVFNYISQSGVLNVSWLLFWGRKIGGYISGQKLKFDCFVKFFVLLPQSYSYYRF